GVAELLRRLDPPPQVAARLKVLKSRHGRASALADTMATLFEVSTTGGALGGATGAQPTSLGTSGLVPMQFSVDARTNTVIVVGTPDQLDTVAAILYQLDLGDARTRTVQVYRLQNAFATPVANALSLWILNERNVYTAAGAIVSPTEALRRDVVVIPEQTTNNLIVSTAP